jgi:hypothetical protein
MPDGAGCSEPADCCSFSCTGGSCGSGDGGTDAGMDGGGFCSEFGEPCGLIPAGGGRPIPGGPCCDPWVCIDGICGSDGGPPPADAGGGFMMGDFTCTPDGEPCVDDVECCIGFCDGVCGAMSVDPP